MNKVFNKLKAIPETAKVSIAYTICSIVQKSLSFITLPLFTRLLTKAQYGQYSVYTSWMAIITIFITLNLPYGSFSTAMIKFEDKRDEYIASVQGICTVLAAIFLVVYIPFSGMFNKLFELPTPLIILMIFEILLHTSVLLWNGKMRFMYKYKAVIGLTLMVSFLSPVLAFILVISSEEKGYARIVGYSAVWIVVGILFFINNFIKGKNFYNKEFWKYALGFNIPLIVYYLSQVIFNQSDRIMIQKIVGGDKGAAEAAVYSVAYSLSTILVFVLNAINNSYVPWFYGKIKENKASDNKKAANMISLLMAFLLMGIIWLAPEIITILAGKEYYEAAWVVPPVTMSNLLLFYSQLFINVEFYFEKKGLLVWASVGAAITNIVLNALLIPRFGFIVAGYTTLVSYVIFAVSNYYTMKKVEKDIGQELDAYDLKGLILIMVAFMALGFVSIALYKYVIIRIVIAAIVLLVAGLNIKKIKAYAKKF